MFFGLGVKRQTSHYNAEPEICSIHKQSVLKATNSLEYKVAVRVEQYKTPVSVVMVAHYIC